MVEGLFSKLFASSRTFHILFPLQAWRCRAFARSFIASLRCNAFADPSLRACNAMPSPFPYCEPAMQCLRRSPIASLRCNAFAVPHCEPAMQCLRPFPHCKPGDAMPSPFPYCEPAMQCLRRSPIASPRCNAFAVPPPPSPGCSKASMARRREYRHRRRTGKYGEDAGTCGNNARRRFSTAGLALQDVVLYIPMLHIHFVAFITQPFINPAGNKNRAMQAARTANCYDQLTLAFFYIIGH